MFFNDKFKIYPNITVTINPNVKYPPMHTYINEGNEIKTTQVGVYHPEEVITH